MSAPGPAAGSAGDAAGGARTAEGWELVAGGAPEPGRRALLLPANMATGAFYQGVLDAPGLRDAGIGAVAATPPGFGGRRARREFFTVEAYAEAIDDLAVAEGFDALVGHSLSANALAAVAAHGRFRGPLVLVAPSLRASNEDAAAHSMRRVSGLPIVGTAAWFALMRVVGLGLRSELPPERRRALVAEMRRNRLRAHARWLVATFDHLEREGPLTPALAAAAATRPVRLLRGADDTVTLDTEDKAALEAAGVVVEEVPGARHFVVTSHPERVAAAIVDVISAGGAAGPQAPSPDPPGEGG